MTRGMTNAQAPMTDFQSLEIGASVGSNDRRMDADTAPRWGSLTPDP